jgi:toxin FitB
MMYMSSMVICEITVGIQKLRRSGATARADRLDVWLDGLVATYTDRILALDVSTARVTGHLSEALTAIGRHPGLADVVIAATAKLHGFAVLTRNLRHFERLGIEVLDPFTSEFPPRTETGNSTP